MLNLLKLLCQTDGVSGCEEGLCQLIKQRVEPYCDQIFEDSMGNLYAFKKGKKPANQKIMLAVHMDEVGLIIKGVTDDGYLKFGVVGGMDTRVLMGKRVRIDGGRTEAAPTGERVSVVGGDCGETGNPSPTSGCESAISGVGGAPTDGIISIKAVHLSNQEERKTVPEPSSLYIDIGAKSREQALQMVNIGDYAAFYSPFEQSGNTLRGRAFDDRVGCAAAIKLIEQTPPVDIWVCFTVQEEVGTRGAKIAANRINPDMAIVIDTTTACDLPKIPDSKTVCNMGGGVVISYMDMGTIYHKPFVEQLTRLAREHKIPHQFKRYLAGGTDAAAISASGQGVPTAGLGIAARYIHSPTGVCNRGDIENMYALLELFLGEFAEGN